MTNQKLYLSRSAIIAVLVHVVVFSLFILGFQMKPEPSQALVDPINIVKAEVIDGAAIEQEKQRIREEKEALEKKKREEALRKQREAEEKKRLEEEAKRRAEAEAEKKRQAEIKKAQEEKRKAEEKAEQEAQARKKAELERQKALEAKKAAEEKARQERIRAEENAKKLAEERKKQEEAKKRAEAEAEQKRLQAILEKEEAEMRAEQERAAKAARQQELNTLQSQYIHAIQSKVQNSWRKPLGMDTSNAVCRVRIKQAIGGYIEEVAIVECSGGNQQFRKSVEEAVWKSDPLPAPPDDDVFLREFILKFKPG